MNHLAGIQQAVTSVITYSANGVLNLGRDSVKITKAIEVTDMVDSSSENLSQGFR